MQTPAVLQLGQFPPALQDIIDSEFPFRMAEADIHDAGKAAQIGAILTRSNQAIPAQLLERLPALRVIATSGVGYDGIPVAAARGRGVVVTNTPGVLDAAVGELAVGLLLALLRKLPDADRFVRSGAWADGVFPLASGLAGKRVGIVGLGRIGQAVAQRLAGFEVTISYTGSRPKDVPYTYVDSLADMARQADILVVSCPGGEATRHLINTEILQRLGANGYLVNVSRGSVVDEAALVAALENGTIRGAALDVFEQEPLTGSRLAALPNTVLTPHVGSATEETRWKMLRLALDNIHAVLAGKPALTPV
jgi:lactate dehydrogenase-like 2-hydroxyacid dehydrogenase